jgi:hypothetical protein
LEKVGRWRDLEGFSEFGDPGDWSDLEDFEHDSLRRLHAEEEELGVFTCAIVSESPEDSTDAMLVILMDASMSVVNSVALRAEPHEKAWC